MKTLKDQIEQDIAKVALNSNEFADRIWWDDVRIPAVVTDMKEEHSREYGTMAQTKIVTIARNAVRLKPVAGDQVRLSFDLMKVDGGDFWDVDHVAEPMGRYRITFSRNAS
ncbi:MAG: hypothetical protein MI862_05415 [Desulfobacterales bacterium]|nr:hypothetical protein [Desulfobacterales bacterium]